MVVNTASECGFTPVRGAETFYGAYKDKGVVVLGFRRTTGGWERNGRRDPDLAGQVPPKPMFAKVKPKGDGQSPVCAFLVAGSSRRMEITVRRRQGRAGRILFRGSVKPDSEAQGRDRGHDQLGRSSPVRPSIQRLQEVRCFDRFSPSPDLDGLGGDSHCVLCPGPNHRVPAPSAKAKVSSASGSPTLRRLLSRGTRADVFGGLLPTTSCGAPAPTRPPS